jgi:hypothetical protein
MPRPNEVLLEIGSRLELFVDRYLVDKTEGTRFELQRPQPADVALTFDRPWEGEFAAMPVVLFHDGVYHMYHRGFTLWREAKDQSESTCYATSRDGIHWTRPELGLVELQGSTRNNAIFPASPFQPVINPRPGVPASERFKGLLPSPRKVEHLGVMIYASADGIHWRKMREEPVLSGKN